MSAKITLEQLKQHTKKDDFYALIHGKGIFALFLLHLSYFDTRN
jgi:hypothetical protein